MRGRRREGKGEREEEELEGGEREEREGKGEREEEELEGGEREKEGGEEGGEGRGGVRGR